MVKKISLILMMTVFTAMFSAACGNGENATPDNGSNTSGAETTDDLDEPVSLNLGHSVTIDDYKGAATEYFAEIVSEMSNGNIEITTFPSETLTTSQDAMKAVASGAADMGAGALSFSVSEVPALAPLDIPGIYDPNHFRETHDAIRPVLDKILATQGVKVLIMFDETDSIFYLNKNAAKSVHSPDDIKGLRLRDHGTWIGKAISAWGGSPMTIIPADLAVALERGTVDGGFTGWGFVNTFRCYETAPYITFTGLNKSTWAPVMINLDLWNSLSQTQQDILTEAAALAEQRSDELLLEYKEDFIDAVSSVGGTIYEMTPEETQVFVDATVPLIEEARSSSGELGNELIDAFQSVTAEFR
jgi:TRAP-type C4-dicarboxylate transport system substrate-binding protein